MIPCIFNLIVGFVPEGELRSVAREIEKVVKKREKLLISAFGKKHYDLTQFTQGAVAMYRHIMEKNK